MAVTIITSVLATLLAAGIIYMISGRFRIWPKVEITYQPGARMSGAGKPGEIDCTWYGNLQLYNRTPHQALDIRIHWPSGTRSLPLEEMKPPHLNGMETRTLALNVKRGFPRETVVQCHDRFKELYPEELGNVSLVLSYKNDRGNVFHTKYVRTHGEAVNTYHHRKPRLK